MKAAKCRVASVGLFLGLIFVLEGCSIEKTDGNKVSDLEFSVVEESEIPTEFLKF